MKPKWVKKCFQYKNKRFFKETIYRICYGNEPKRKIG
jgi:hypothetical protein